MITGETAWQVWLATGHTVVRKGFDGLRARDLAPFHQSTATEVFPGRRMSYRSALAGREHRPSPESSGIVSSRSARS